MAKSPIVFVLSRLEEMLRVLRPYTHRPTSQGFAALRITGPLLAISPNDLQQHEVLRKRQMGQIRGEEPG